MATSELPGFYRLDLQDRRDKVAALTGLSARDLDELSGDGGLGDEHADRMVENALGVLGIPLGLCANLRVNGRDCLVPMATEEPSVVAAASYAAKLMRAGGGMTTELTPPHMIGQVQVLEVSDPQRAEAALLANKDELLAAANADHPSLVAAGGGAIDMTVRYLASLGEHDPCGAMLIVHLIVDVCDAMGANAINSMCEHIAPRIQQLCGGRVGLRILSNLADRRLVTVRGRVPFCALQGRGCDSPAQLARNIVEASVFAERDPYRAATHNKGIMNGIDSVLLAFGQDFRAVEAGAHAYAARNGRYQAMARWRIEGETLCGELTVPMAVGTVGGVARVHPTVRVTRRLAQIDSAAQLASITAAVGLAQNLSALRALAAEGIQHGHMRLHARNVAVEAGACGDDVAEVARIIAADGAVNVAAAKAALLVLEARRLQASKVPSVYGAHTEGSLLRKFDSFRADHWPAMRALIEEVVVATVPPSSTLQSMNHYHFETGGKRLRAVLPLLVAEVMGEDVMRMRPVGAACEMLHNATLVHDDLQDGDLVRRGRMTIWNRFGMPQAVNLGDAMFYFAVLLCQRTHVAATIREAFARRLLTATLRVIDGQEREFTLKTQPQVSLEDYFTMVEGKTSGLFALPMAAAAELCGADPPLVAALEEAARHMGVLFQIQDDVLDLYGDKGRDSRGCDIAEGKRSVLVVHALSTAPASKKKWLREVLDKQRSQTGAGEVDEAIALIADVGSLQFSLDEIDRRKQQAVAVVDAAGQPALSALVASMCELFKKPIDQLQLAR